ncbi:MAG: ABC transporter ATP-binding protein [Pirellulaceae bacterium]|nr:ABC transporter ATP-binding protein [Pirellulaceae bacterium]
MQATTKYSPRISYHVSAHAGGAHLQPLQRFFRLLNLDRQDIGTIALFSFVASILSLVSPLAVEALVNVVSWGIYLQPLLILALILFVALTFVAFLNVLQATIVEIIQRRLFVRIVAELSHRFPRASRMELAGAYPREIANRVFDIMTIQKSMSVLLLDGISIILVTVLGLLLLGFYHPFLLGFDLILIMLMTIVMWLLGWGGTRTSILESVRKYRVVHWLQDVLDTPSAFHVNGGQKLAVERASQLSADYVQARKSHFHVLLRQLAFAAGIQVFALTTLLGLGGWLVIEGELTLGQLVASELVVTIVLAAFTKGGKSIEKFFDLMAGLEKVGHLQDLALVTHQPISIDHAGPLAIQWDRIESRYGNQLLRLDACQVPAGTCVALLTWENPALVMKVLSGLLVPHTGRVTVQGIDTSRLASGSQQEAVIGYASRPSFFCGTISENVALGRDGVDEQRVREVLQQVDLWSDVAALPHGPLTQLQSDGYPLSEVQQCRLMIAQALAARPRILLIEALLDNLPPKDQLRLFKLLRSEHADCTTLISTRLPGIAEQCDDQIRMEA